jgi:hypothetical protein
LEKLGKPGVFFTTDNFGKDARSAAGDTGLPTMRIVELPAARYYRDRGSKERIAPVVKEVFAPFIDALTRPLTSAEKNPNAAASGLNEPIKISADSYELALEKFNELYLKNKWSDGLPLVAPTPERVKWILTGTSRSPKDVIGTVKPKNGIATVEKIAINAVMAGAKPEYLPVIIAAMESLADKSFDVLHVMLSSGSFNLVIAISGPIVKEIGMNDGIGYLSYGYRANSTIGRAVRLNMINLGYLWPADNDMALVGRASSHTFFVVPENQSENPWKPYHVTQGFKPEDSCVTVSVIGGYGTSAGSQYGGGAVGIWSADQILKSIVAEFARDRRSISSWTRGVGSTPGSGGAASKHIILMMPELAQELNKAGHTPEELQDYLWRQSAASYEDLKPEEIESVQKAIEVGYIPPSRASTFKEALKPGGKVPVIIEPGDIHIMVAGGIPGYTLSLSYYRVPPYAAVAHMTRPIRGATITKSGH